MFRSDEEIVDTWKWMGSPVWELNGIICVGNIFTNKVKLVFIDGAALRDPDNIFTAELEGNTRRGIDFFEADQTNEGSLQALVRAAISHNQTRASFGPLTGCQPGRECRLSALVAPGAHGCLLFYLGHKAVLGSGRSVLRPERLRMPGRASATR